MNRICRNCVYVHSRAKKKGLRYECRRFPPQNILYKDTKNRIDSFHPDVKWSHWCGEFKDASQPDTEGLQ